MASRLLASVHPGLSQVLQTAVVAETIDQRFDSRRLAASFPIQLTRLETWIAEHVPGGTRDLPSNDSPSPR